MSYGLTVKLLQEVLPIGNSINAATVRSNVHAVGQRIDKELDDELMGFIDGCEYDWEQLPPPDPPLTVGIDGGYVHSRSQSSRMDIDSTDLTQKQQKLIKKLDDFETYIRNNAMLIPNYGERWRYGESIPTAFVESTINEVVSNRMVKKQQMRWSRHGAHLLLQVRTRVLNDELREIFQQWYPRFVQQEQPLKKAA